MAKHYFECECCDRPVVAQKKPGIGYYCDPCVKCFGWGQGYTPEPESMPASGCFYDQDLAWMQSQIDSTQWYIERLGELRER